MSDEIKAEFFIVAILPYPRKRFNLDIVTKDTDE